MINTTKKKFVILFLFIFILSLSACVQTNQPNKPIDPIEPNKPVEPIDPVDPVDPIDPIDPVDEINFLDIYSLNDFHGAVLDDNDNQGIARIGNYLIQQKQKSPNNTIILAAGDMFQGSGVSNLTFGGVVVEAMNYIGFDAMTIGNHEFDWGVNRLLSFHDESNSQVKANFPFLSANIYEKSTNELASWAQPYTIIERGSLKIGIIGTLGVSQINSISASLVEPFVFKNPIPIIKDITHDLRVNKGVDFVIVSAHDHEEYLNEGLINLSGSYRVDAVINAHTHRTYAREDYRPNLAPLPIVQAGSSGSHIGHIRLNIDFENKKVTSVSAENIPVYSTLATNHPEIEKIVSQALEKARPILEEEIGTSGRTIYKTDAIQWGANTIKKYSGADFGVVNSGAFRTGFPVYSNNTITVGDVYEWMPFDNIIKTVKLTKAQISSIVFGGNDLVFSDNFNYYELQDGKFYTFATVDYVFDKDYYPFLTGKDITYVGDLFRDYLIRSIKETKENNQLWTAR